MDFSFEFIDYKKNSEEELKKFIEDINYDLPIPVSEKTNIDIFLQKIKKNGNVIIAKKDKKIIGGLFFYANNYKEKISFLSLLAVKKEYRNNHIASTLIDMYIDYCKKIKFRKIYLYTHKTNDKAKRVYLKKNFKTIASDRKGDIKLEYSLREENKL